MEQVIEKWMGRVNEAVIGATAENGGTRKNVIKVGGSTTLPYLHFEGAVPNPPVIALEVHDCAPQHWPQVLREPFKDVLDNPAEWAKKCVNGYGADLICLRLTSTAPDGLNRSADKAAETVTEVKKAVPVPLIIIGSGNAEKDAEIAPSCAQAAKGENCLMGIAVQDNYKTITAACQSGGHCIIAESPIDINLAKQLNILITDTGYPQGKIVMHQSTGALGYGLEYTYSIMERARLASLSGDKMMSMPVINFIGNEVWRTKEAKSDDIKDSRGILWETVTAIAYVHAGTDILVMLHPEAAKWVKKEIKTLVNK